MYFWAEKMVSQGGSGGAKRRASSTSAVAGSTTVHRNSPVLRPRRQDSCPRDSSATSAQPLVVVDVDEISASIERFYSDVDFAISSPQHHHKYQTQPSAYNSPSHSRNQPRVHHHHSQNQHQKLDRNNPAGAGSGSPMKRASLTVAENGGGTSELVSACGKHFRSASHGTLTPIIVGGRQLLNIIRAFVVRFLFIVHSITTIWATVNIRADPSIWTFALVSALIAIEGSYAIVVRAGDERKWFSPSVLLYILATVPPLHLLETQICEWRKNGNEDKLDEKMYFQLLEQLLLVLLIIGRWLLPKGQISREQLSQILLAYLAISSDIVEFFDVFKEKPVYENRRVQHLVLGAWTLSLFQFPFVLTVSRARKMRVAIIEEDDTDMLVIKRKKSSSFWQLVYDIDIWAIVLANCLQDIPFFVVRLYLMTYHGLLTYTMIFFLCKNALIIVLQTYRAFVLINDRYVHPSSGANHGIRRPSSTNASPSFTTSRDQTTPSRAQRQQQQYVTPTQQHQRRSTIASQAGESSGKKNKRNKRDLRKSKNATVSKEQRECEEISQLKAEVAALDSTHHQAGDHHPLVGGPGLGMMERQVEIKYVPSEGPSKSRTTRTT